jgi:hypothetical protein
MNSASNARSNLLQEGSIKGDEAAEDIPIPFYPNLTVLI